MGKSLKGRELGIGISQQKDGLYVGRYTTVEGKRVSKRFKNLKECKEFMSSSDVLQRANVSLSEMTVDQLTKPWLEEKSKVLKYRTYNTYESTYRIHIKNYIGNMKVKDVKRAHIQNIIIKEGERLKNGTLERIVSVLSSFFRYAQNSDIINKMPTDGVYCKLNHNDGKTVVALTRDEQQLFLEKISGTRYELQFTLILNTGLRISELCGLKWEDIDFEKRTLKVQRAAVVYDGQGINLETPKSESGYREIPLTDNAYQILKQIRMNKKIVPFENSEFIFTSCYGNITNKRNYAVWLQHHRDEWGLPNLTPHVLRHTFATRCIEGGMQPKTLQKLLGHSRISTTMDLYVHVTERQKQEEIKKVESFLSAM